MCRLLWDTYVRNACILRRALLHMGLVPLGSYPALGPGILDPEGGLVGGYLFMGCRSSYNRRLPKKLLYTNFKVDPKCQSFPK